MTSHFSMFNSDILICNEKNVESIRRHAKFLTLYLKETSKLTESYILDYFVEKLWTCLPYIWLDIVLKFESDDLEKFLDCESHITYRKPWPLSLLSFRAAAFSLALPRKPIRSLKCIKSFVSENFSEVNVPYKCFNEDSLDSAYEDKSGQHKNIPEFCRRHVKPKKQHEIFRMAQLTATIVEALGIKNIVDVGSGQGHLSRFLSLCHNLNVATVEAEQSHIFSATNFDKQAFLSMKNQRQYITETKKKETSDILDYHALPHHLEGSMTVESSKEFLNKIFRKSEAQASNSYSEEVYALLGLHTCGDLASTILRMFATFPQCKALISVGCCYMKLTSNMDNLGYPLSNHVETLPHHHLSYEAKEMSCHALEMYIQRLRENAPTLKIHCYRATLEKCIVEHYPNKKHMGLRGVKHAELLEFSEYAEKAMSKVSLTMPKKYFQLPDIQNCLNRWKEVLIFYTLRLITAPVVESLILLDRMLFLYENGYSSCIIPLFDPSVSPRNHVLISASVNNKL